MVVAVDHDGGLAKRIYEDSSTNTPSLAYSNVSSTLVVGDSQLSYLAVARDRAAFDAMDAINERGLAAVAGRDEILDDLRARSGTRANSTLRGVADDAVVHAVGVYEGELPGGERRGFREHKQGEVTVNVGGSGRAILVLTAYEPVKWTVRPRGVFIDQILLFGYYDQEVVAPPGSKVFTNLATAAGSSRIHAYKKDKNHNQLQAVVREITGKEIDTFQGKYRAGSFQVNSSGSAAAKPGQVPGVHKWVDDDGVVHYGDGPARTTSETNP